MNEESKQNSLNNFRKSKNEDFKHGSEISDHEEIKLGLFYKYLIIHQLQSAQYNSLVRLNNDPGHLRNQDSIKGDKGSSIKNEQYEENNEEETKEVSLKFFTQQFLDIGDI